MIATSWRPHVFRSPRRGSTFENVDQTLGDSATCDAAGSRAQGFLKSEWELITDMLKKSGYQKRFHRTKSFEIDLDLGFEKMHFLDGLVTKIESSI